MGIIGDAFFKLFGVIWDVIVWIGSLIKLLFQGLVDILIAFFQVIYQLIEGVLYLIYMIGVLAVKFFLVLFEALKVLWSLIVGFARSLGSIAYTPRSGAGHGYSSMLGELFEYASIFQLNSFAVILSFGIWFGTAVAAIKLISSIRVGGD
ncbi:hypothetical protein [Cytobacillus gottheilii]|uniref:hypothetical protein n=1 Tax=Cytobacillus gottheilii TaxID=859144 RepID=UPI00082D698E|nr:hypothetical protein [Cytobacillus gottheilii]